MRLVKFCEDGEGVLPILSHLQMKYTVSKACLVGFATSAR